MKILILSHLWEPEEGSPQRRWTWLSQGLLDEGHDLTVICPPPHYPYGKLLSEKPQHQRWAVEHINPRYRIYRTTFRPHNQTLRSRIVNEAVVTGALTVTAIRQCFKDRPDAIIATCPPIPVMFAQRIVASLFRVPVVLDLRDAWPDLLDYVLISEIETSPKLRQTPVRVFAFKQLTKLTTRLVSRTIRRADALSVTSQNFAERLKSEFHRSVEVIYNLGVRSETLPDRHSDPAEPLRIIYAGTVGRAQRLQTALDAVRILRDEGTPVQMRIFGGGAHLRTLQKNTAKLELPIEFLHRLPYDEIFHQYEWADTILVMLQPWQPLEMTIPSKLIEALTLNRHITVSANGEATDIITEAQVGHAVPAGDAQALAALWRKLANDRSQLKIETEKQLWHQRLGSPRDQIDKLLRLVVDVTVRHT